MSHFTNERHWRVWVTDERAYFQFIISILNSALLSRQGEEWLRYRKILSPLLLKTATLHRHIESFYDVADRLLDKWEHTENGLITHLEGDLYRYFVQVHILVLVNWLNPEF